MAGFDNDVMYADNVDFRGVQPVTGQVTTNGQLLIGSTISPNIRVGNITSTGGTITVTNLPGSINLDLAGGSVGIDSIAVQATTAPGVSPVLPTGAGLMTVSGAGVAALGIPLQSRSTALNSYQLEVQRTSAQALSSAVNAGIGSFSNAQFSVDINGFVTNLNGLPISAVDVDGATAPGTDPVLPTALGVMGVGGAQVAAGTVSSAIRTQSIAANSYQIQVQRSSAQPVSSVTQNGVCHFNDAQFSVDANGFVSSLATTMSWIDSIGGGLVNHTGYFATAIASYTLPAGVANGDQIEIVDTIGGGVVVTAQGGNFIQIQNVASSANGTATSTQKGDALRLTFRLADVTWYEVPGSGGNWNLA